MKLTDHPLPITHQHRMKPSRPAQLRAALRKADKDELRRVPSISSSRIPMLPIATQLLEALVVVLDPKALVVSSFGIREGLLYDELAPDEQALDPLIEAAREVGAGLGRSPSMAGCSTVDRARVRRSHPERAAAARRLPARRHRLGRASRLPGRARHRPGAARQLGGDRRPGRVMLAQALFSSLGGGRELLIPTSPPCARPRSWTLLAVGYAMRLGQRLSGGVAAGLERSRLLRKDGVLRLEVQRGRQAAR